MKLVYYFGSESICPSSTLEKTNIKNFKLTKIQKKKDL